MVDELLVECPHRAEGCQETVERQMVQVHLREECVFGERLRRREEDHTKMGKDGEKEQVHVFFLIIDLIANSLTPRYTNAHTRNTVVHSSHPPHQTYQLTYIHAHTKHSKISFLPTTPKF